MKHTLAYLITYLILLTACSTNSAPLASTTPIASGCTATGKPQTLLALAPTVEGNWPMFHRNLQRDGASVDNGSDGRTPLTLAWTYCTGAAILSSPIVSAGVLYIAATNGTLTALNAQNGRPLWHYHAGGAFYSTPALQDGILYLGALDGFVYAIRASTGQLQWRSQVDGIGAKVWSSPAVANGLVMVGVASSLNEQPKVAGEVLAFDAHTGERRWRTWIMPNGAAGGGVWSSPAIDIGSGRVFVGTGDPDDGAQAFDLRNGRVLWHWRSVSQDIGDTDVGSGPGLYTDHQGRLRVAVGGKNGTLYSLDGRSGQVLWQTHIANHIFGAVAIANGTLYAVGVQVRSSVAWALDAETGKSLWQRNIPYIVYASPAISRKALYISVGDGFSPDGGGIDVLDPTSGALLQFVDLHSGTTSSTAVLPHWLFVGSADGNASAFVR